MAFVQKLCCRDWKPWWQGNAIALPGVFWVMFLFVAVQLWYHLCCTRNRVAWPIRMYGPRSRFARPHIQVLDTENCSLIVHK